MAKSARASSIKANNARLKKNVFGPVETARNERLSAKLLELAAAPKPKAPEKEAEMEDAVTAAAEDETAQTAGDDMEVDSGSKKAASKKAASKKQAGIRKRKGKKSITAFPKSKDRVSGRKKK